ncbi:SPASM domain-containing protein [Actinokineospora xionganensis]
MCGQCAGDVLAIYPDGAVRPCVFTRSLQVGDVLESSLRQVVNSPQLATARTAIATATAQNQHLHDSNCNPNCNPCNPLPSWLQSTLCACHHLWPTWAVDVGKLTDPSSAPGEPLGRMRTLHPQRQQ